MKYPDMKWSRMQAIIDKLGGEEGVDRFLRGEPVIKMAERSFAIWRTITLGVHQSPGAYRKALKANKCVIDDYADQILDKIKISETKTQVDLVMMTAVELGFKGKVTRQQIYDRANELGLKLCPAEVGPALRLQYLECVYAECLRIVMEPISASDGLLVVFGVYQDYGKLPVLYGGYGQTLLEPGFNYYWVFVAPHK